MAALISSDEGYDWRRIKDLLCCLHSSTWSNWIEFALVILLKHRKLLLFVVAASKQVGDHTRQAVFSGSWEPTYSSLWRWIPPSTACMCLKYVNVKSSVSNHLVLTSLNLHFTSWISITSVSCPLEFPYLVTSNYNIFRSFQIFDTNMVKSLICHSGAHPLWVACDDTRIAGIEQVMLLNRFYIFSAIVFVSSAGCIMMLFRFLDLVIHLFRHPSPCCKSFVFSSPDQINVHKREGVILSTAGSGVSTLLGAAWKCNHQSSGMLVVFMVSAVPFFWPNSGVHRGRSSTMSHMSTMSQLWVSSVMESGCTLALKMAL